jgi:hypothetical protein
MTSRAPSTRPWLAGADCQGRETSGQVSFRPLPVIRSYWQAKKTNPAEAGLDSHCVS